jgi:hypothetical protein
VSVMNYETAQDLFDALSAPFPPDAIDWRVGSTNADKSKGMALAYIDARTVMDRLDTMCGPDAWQDNYSPGVGGSIICNLGVRFPNSEWIWKADGAGATDYEGEKGALSDAFKRAAVRFGIGRYLYDLKAPWVAIEPMGKSFRIKEDEKKKLDEVHEKEAQRVGWGGPTDVATYRVLLRIVQDTVTQASDVDAFREKYKGMLPMLRIAARRHLEQQLDRIGGTQQEAAE